MGLPQLGTTEFDLLEAKYETCSIPELIVLAHKYGYKTVDSFQRQMRKAGVKRNTTNGGWEPAGINIPLKLVMAKEPKTIAAIGDTHNPYHDAETLALTENILETINPDVIVYMGDMSDFYQISTFSKNPNRLDNLQEDINSTKAMFRRHMAKFPKAEKYLIEGNHEYRLQSFLWNHAVALESLDCLKVGGLYGLEEYGIKHIPYEQGLMVNDVFLMIHSDIASIHSSYTAKRLYEKHGGCGICGHTHRGGSYYKRDRFGIWGWWENFCLCHLNPDWIKNPNWQQGFSLIHFIGKRFWVEQIPIIDHELMYGGKVYKGNG